MVSQLQAGIMALVTTVVALVVAYVPQLRPTESLIIAAVGAAVSLAFLITNAVVAHAHAKVVVARPDVAVNKALR